MSNIITSHGNIKVREQYVYVHSVKKIVAIGNIKPQQGASRSTSFLSSPRVLVSVHHVQPVPCTLNHLVMGPLRFGDKVSMLP